MHYSRRDAFRRQRFAPQRRHVGAMRAPSAAMPWPRPRP